MMVINQVFQVRATAEPDVYLMTLIVNDKGQTYQCQYVSSPNDPHGINPHLRDWLATNEYTILPHEVI